jgi:hypothetical protein
MNTLAGRVFLPAVYRTQVEIKDVAIAATVSLIDSSTNTTIATALTDSNGAFVFDLSRFIPAVGTTYALEAVKGLSNNSAGFPAVRVRTFIRFEGGWRSTTGSSITISRATTAVAIIASLRGLNTANFLGSVQVGPPVVFNPPGTGTSQNDFDRVLKLVDDALKANRDPVDSIIWNGSDYEVKAGVGGLNPVLVDVIPSAMGIGGTVTLVGSNFAQFGTGNTVKLGSLDAQIVAVGSNSVSVIVPVGGQSGLFVLGNPLGTSSIAFTVISDVGGAVSPPGNYAGVPGGDPDATGTPAPDIGGDFKP